MCANSPIRSAVLRSALFLCLPFLVAACDLVDLHRLTVETVPGTANEIVEVDTSLSATFSRPVTRESAERAFRLEENGTEVHVDFEWSDDGFSATPVETPAPGVRHELHIEGTVIDNRRLDHNIDLYIPFYFGSNATRPYISSHTPESGADVGVFAPLTLRFNIAVDPGSVEDAFSISPNTDFDFEWNGHNTSVAIYPGDQWEPATFYRWSLSTGARSSERVPTPKLQAGSFITQSDAIPPDLEEYRFTVRESGLMIETPQLQTDGAVVIAFSKAVRFASVREAVSVSPSVSAAVEQLDGKEFHLRFDEPLDAERQYEVRVSDALRDLSGNPPPAQRAFVVQPVGAHQHLPAARSFWSNAGEEGTVELDLAQDIDETTIVGVGRPDGTNTLQFDFAFAYESKAGRDSLLDALELRAVLPERTVNPDIEQIRWLDDGARLRMSFAGLESSRSPAEPSIYRLRIASGEASATGAAQGLAQPLVVYLKTEVQD